MVSPSRRWFAQCRDLDASNRPAKGHPEGGQSLTILKNNLALTVSQGCMPLRAKASIGPLRAAKKNYMIFQKHISKADIKLWEDPQTLPYARNGFIKNVNI